MHLIKIEYSGIKIFDRSTFSVDFYAENRVMTSDESVFKINKSIYTNNLIALAGKNASGKTLLLSFTRLALTIASGKKIGNPFIDYVFRGILSNPFVFKCIVEIDEKFYALVSELRFNPIALDSKDNTPIFSIDDEWLYRIKGKDLKRKSLDSIDGLVNNSRLIQQRNVLDKQTKRYLDEDSSIIKMVSDRRTYFSEIGPSISNDFFWFEPNINMSEIVPVFDSSVDALDYTDDFDKYVISLKDDECPRQVTFYELKNILSSGTLKGLNAIPRIINVLKSGGYLFFDEIENSFNKKLVEMIIGIFTSSDTNPYGATLIFTTHYPEILDGIERKDDVYFICKNNEEKIEVIKYSDKIERIENKKSEVFFSNYVNGTAPSYFDIKNLYDLIGKAVKSYQND